MESSAKKMVRNLFQAEETKKLNRPDKHNKKGKNQREKKNTREEVRRWKKDDWNTSLEKASGKNHKILAGFKTPTKRVRNLQKVSVLGKRKNKETKKGKREGGEKPKRRRERRKKRAQGSVIWRMSRRLGKKKMPARTKIETDRLQTKQ